MIKPFTEMYTEMENEEMSPFGDRNNVSSSIVLEN